MAKMKIKTTKIRRGFYRIEREDGLVVEARRGLGGWLANSTTRATLSLIKYDLKMGNTPWPNYEAT